MNQVFSLNRFLLLFKKHTVDNYKTYLMSFFVLSSLLFGMLGFIAYTSRGALSSRDQGPIFLIFLVLAGTIFTSTIFADLGSKKKAISILSLPASQFEKFLVGWTYSYLIFQLLFILIFYSVVLIVSKLSYFTGGGGDAVLLDLFSGREEIYKIFYVYAVLHALAMCGSIYFHKHHFIKTTFIFFVTLFSVSFLNIKLLPVLFGEQMGGSRFNTLPFHAIYENGNRLDVPESDWFLLAVLIMVVLILWTSSYYKLKEKEV